MEKAKMTDTSSAGPIKLDPEQLKELDKLIDNLKKEIICPELKKGEHSALDRAEL